MRHLCLSIPISINNRFFLLNKVIIIAVGRGFFKFFKYPQKILCNPTRMLVASRAIHKLDNTQNMPYLGMFHISLVIVNHTIHRLDHAQKS